MDQVVAARGDRVLVPVLGLDRSLDRVRFADGADDLDLPGSVDDGLLSALGQDTAPLLLVQDPGVALPGLDVRLVPARDPVAQVLAAVLNAGVPANDAVREPELEVLDGALAPDQEGV